MVDIATWRCRIGRFAIIKKERKTRNKERNAARIAVKILGVVAASYLAFSVVLNYSLDKKFRLRNYINILFKEVFKEKQLKYNIF